MKLILKNARVVDPARQLDARGDVGIHDGRIVEASALSRDAATEIVDLHGQVVTPGLIDMHVHLREPGQEYKEDLASGTRAAAAGGFTTVLAMPNTVPAMDSVAMLEDLAARVGRSAIVRVLTVACLTQGRKGKVAADVRSYVGAGGGICAGLSDDGTCVQDFATMLELAKIAAEIGLPIIDHCEDEHVMEKGVMRRGPVSELLQVPGMPGETESNMVARNIELSRQTGAHLHMQHISYVESVRLVREARQEGLNVTAEAMPHHLLLTADALPVCGTNAKMNPPLGTEADRLALLEGVVDGSVSVIATDHAPHAPFEKARSIVEAPFGIIGLETALPLLLSELVAKGYLDLSTLIARFTLGPAAVLGLATPSLRPGEVADLAILDLDAKWTIDANRSVSKSRNTPFHGRRVAGKVTGTMLGGRWLVRDGRLLV